MVYIEYEGNTYTHYLRLFSFPKRKRGEREPINQTQKILQCLLYSKQSNLLQMYIAFTQRDLQCIQTHVTHELVSVMHLAE